MKTTLGIITMIRVARNKTSTGMRVSRRVVTRRKRTNEGKVR